MYTRTSQREGEARSSPSIEELKERLHVAETLLRRFLPDVDLAHPENTLIFGRDATPGSGTASTAATTPATTASDACRETRGRFIPLVEKANQLDRTSTGEYSFHGMSSGAAFLSRITQYLPGLPRYDARMPFLPQPPRPWSSADDPTTMTTATATELPAHMLKGSGGGGGSSNSSSSSPWSPLVRHGLSRLPLRQLAHDLCEYAFSRASCLLRVVHVPSFWAAFERLYAERPQQYTLAQQRFVGLLFAAMALGSMYDVDENDPTNPDHYAVATERGYHYYAAARHALPDLTECGDVTTLQALVFAIQFLQATGNLHGGHSFVGIALRSALRMGLHRHLPHAALPPVEDETRRRLFHTIRSMDIYLSTTLGLPLLLQDKDVDQRWPTEVDDDDDGGGGDGDDDGAHGDKDAPLPPSRTPSFLEAFNAHARLMHILARVVEYVYPPTGTDKGPQDVTYLISAAKIKELEQELHDWQGRLSPTWRSAGPQEDLQITRYVKQKQQQKPPLSSIPLPTPILPRFPCVRQHFSAARPSPWLLPGGKASRCTGIVWRVCARQGTFFGRHRQDRETPNAFENGWGQGRKGMNAETDLSTLPRPQRPDPPPLRLRPRPDDALPPLPPVLLPAVLFLLVVDRRRRRRRRGRAVPGPRDGGHQRLPQHHPHRPRAPQAGRPHRPLLVHHLHAVLRRPQPAALRRPQPRPPRRLGALRRRPPGQGLHLQPDPAEPRGRPGDGGAECEYGRKGSKT